MVHEFYDVNAVHNLFDTFDPCQQTGSGGDQQPIYRGVRFHRGYGYQRGGSVVGVLSKVWRYLKPMARKYIAPVAKEALNALKEEGIEAGKNVLTGLAEGKDAKDALVVEGTQALKKLAKRAGKRIEQAGSGKVHKKRPRKPAKRSVSNLHLVGRSVLESSIAKKNSKKNLGFY